MLSLLLTVSVLAAGPLPVKLAAPNLSGANMKSDELNFFTDHLAQQLGFNGVRVITSSEINSLLGFERQKQLLGCADNTASCQAELANALGVDGLVTGAIGRVGKSFQINLKIIKAEDGTPLAAYSARATSDEAVLDRLTDAAEVMAKQVIEKLGRTPVKAAPVEEPKKTTEVAKVEPPKEVEVAVAPTQSVETSEPAEAEVRTGGGGLRAYAWVPAGAGLALGAVGALFIVQGEGKADEIRKVLADDTIADRADRLTRARSLQAQGEMQRGLGAVMAGVGVAAVAAGAAMFLMGGTTQVAVVPGPEPTVAVRGTFDLVSTH